MKMFFNTVYRKQKGTAIFMSLLVVAIATAITILWFSQIRISVRRTNQILTSQQVNLYADGVMGWAVAALKKDGNELPKILPPTKLSGGLGIISGRIDAYPLQADNIQGGSTAANQLPQQGANIPSVNNPQGTQASPSQIPQELAMASAASSMGTAGKQAMASGGIPGNEAGDVGKKFFLLRTDVKLADQYLVLYSLLHLKTVNGKTEVEVVAQSRGNT